jgi:predicted GIY-YIG superfamily endonuclease
MPFCNEPTNYDIYLITRIKECERRRYCYIGIARNFKSRYGDHRKKFKLGEVYKMESIFNKFMTRTEAETWEQHFLTLYRIEKNYKFYNRIKVPYTHVVFLNADEDLNDKFIKWTKEEKLEEKRIRTEYLEACRQKHRERKENLRAEKNIKKTKKIMV